MFAVLCYVLVVLSTLVDSTSLIVDTPLGKIRGLEVTANNSKTYWSFRGIPYAKPPLGKLRFAKPEALPYQDKIIDGTASGKPCIQAPMILLPDEITSEDCLILNVYTKNVDLDNPKKVLVWIHGGMFLYGSSSVEAGTFVTDHDVIVVTINYRLGLLGFFSTEDDASPGNYALWDQTLAIKWVKFNIGAFGGDPDDITISGESAGGGSVSLLSLSPVTKGLFTKAYSQSGAATSLFAKYSNPRSAALEIAKSFNCSDGHEIKGNTTSSKLIIDCLRTIPADAFIPVNYFDGIRSMTPRADGELLPKTPLSLLKDTYYLEQIGFYNRTYLFGMNNNEKSTIEPFHYGTLQAIFENVLLNDSQKEKLWQDFQKKAYSTSVSESLELGTLPNQILQTVIDWYEDRNVGDSAVPVMVTDLQFYIPAFQILNAIARSKTTDAYLLYFNYYPHYMRGDARGTVHGLDLAYWFDLTVDQLQRMLSSKTPINFDAQDKRVKARFAAIIASFVKSGNPSQALRDIIPTGWPTYDLLDAQYLDFNQRPTVQTHLMREQLELWEKTVASLVAHDPCS